MKSDPGQAEAQNGRFLKRIYREIHEIWTWAGKGPKWWLLNEDLLENQ